MSSPTLPHNCRSVDFLIIGAGTCGFKLALSLAQRSKNVLIVEEEKWDCPLIGNPHRALTTLKLAVESIKNTDREKMFFEAMHRVKQYENYVQSHIKSKSSLSLHGAHCMQGHAEFMDPHHIRITQDIPTVSEKSARTELIIRAKNIIITSGQTPYIPSNIYSPRVRSIKQAFHWKHFPSSITILGAGNKGCSLAQAYRKLGIDCTLINASAHILPSFHSPFTPLLQQYLSSEGITIFNNSKLIEAKDEKDCWQLLIEDKKGQLSWHQSQELIVTAGRRPCIELGLEASGIAYDSYQGIYVDCYGQTTQPHIWALGSCCTSPHISYNRELQINTWLDNIRRPSFLAPFTRWPKKKFPRSAYTEQKQSLSTPNLSTVGVQWHQVYKDRRFRHMRFKQCDMIEYKNQAQAKNLPFAVEIIYKPFSGKIVGASILDENAQDCLALFTLAIKESIPLYKLGQLSTPYPNFYEIFKAASKRWQLKRKKEIRRFWQDKKRMIFMRKDYDKHNDPWL